MRPPRRPTPPVMIPAPWRRICIAAARPAPARSSSATRMSWLARPPPRRSPRTRHAWPRSPRARPRRPKSWPARPRQRRPPRRRPRPQPRSSSVASRQRPGRPRRPNRRTRLTASS
ncbi:hypothetical protein ACFFX0_17955 [Citricoccus parietis]|uniref:Uncharacterized protein n=1 Tax=Citricoccus parietis TaxID=592307 RepID=A0ABV5G250_9MICC